MRDDVGKRGNLCRERVGIGVKGLKRGATSGFKVCMWAKSRKKKREWRWDAFK